MKGAYKIMTNDALRAMISELGERISIIIFDNNFKVYIGYPSSGIKSVNEIQFKTFGDFDMIGIPRKTSNPKMNREGVTITDWHPTECIQLVATLDEGFENYRIDPMDFC
jgi:hypothetical protein